MMPKLTAVAMLLVAGFASGQGLAQSQPKLYTIAGTMTDAASGQILPGSTLTLASTAGPSRQTIQTKVVDATGNFKLDPVPAGKYSLTGSRRGYLRANYDEHDTYSSAIVTGDDQDTEHLRFQLRAGGMIRGVVTDDSGDPVTGAQVLLMRQAKEGGLGDHLVREISGQPDDTGLFEFWGLTPGSYFLAVSGAPWFAVHPVQPALGHAESSPLDVAYPVTYYPGTTDEATAAPIPLVSGQRVQADVTMHAVPALRITIHMPQRVDAGRQEGYGIPAMLRQTIFGDQQVTMMPPQQSGSPESGAMEFDGVAPGHYTVDVRDPPRSIRVDATSSQEVDPTSGMPGFSVDLKARMTDGSEIPSPLTVNLLSDDGVRRQLSTNVMEKGTAHFEGVPAGTWLVQASENNAALAVVSMQAGATAAPDNRLVVKDQAVTATARLGRGKTNVEGFATKDGKGKAGVMIVLVPKAPGASIDLFRRDQSDSDGSFSLLNVVPGEYTIVAIEDGWQLAWARPEVNSRFLSEGTPVVVTAKSGAEMHLASPVVVQAP